MSNIERIEQIVSLTDEIDGVTGSVFASVSWSYAASLANAVATTYRVHNPEDPRFGKLSAETKAETIDRLETRIMELESVLAWAASRANGDFLPSGEEVVSRLEKPGQGGREMDVEGIAELMGITKAQAQAAADAEAKRQEQDQVLTAQHIELNHKALVTRTDRAIAAPIDSGFELSSRDAVRILERIAEKLETYGQRRVARAFRTRRSRTVARLAAERRLLDAAMNKADELAERIGIEEEALANEVLEGRRNVA